MTTTNFIGGNMTTSKALEIALKMYNDAKEEGADAVVLKLEVLNQLIDATAECLALAHPISIIRKIVEK